MSLKAGNVTTSDVPTKPPRKETPMKTMLALLAFASFALTGCATQPETAQAQAQTLDTPSKMVKAEYDAPITASRLPSTKVQ